MYIKDFDTTERKLQTLQTYLKSTFGYEVSADKSNAAELLEATNARLENEKDDSARARLLLVAETLTLISESVDSDTVEKAKVIMAANEITDKLIKMAEDAANMQVKDVPAVAEAMREEIGQNEAQAFEQSAGQALEELTANIKTTREAVQGATSTAQGEGGGMATDMDAEVDAEVDVDVDVDADADFGDTGEMPADDVADADDVFGGDDAAAGGEEPLGRGMKEEGYESALHELRGIVENGRISRADLAGIISKYRG